MKKAARYGGVERACDVTTEWPILTCQKIAVEEKALTYSWMMVGKKTGNELKATLEQKNIAWGHPLAHTRSFPVQTIQL